MQEAVKPTPMTFTDRMRLLFKGVIDPLATFLNNLGLTPNAVTILGLLGNLAGAVLVAFGHFTIGGLVLLVFSPLDALDGTMARLRGEASSYGAFIDSVTDRYSELFLLGGLMFYYTQQHDWLLCLLAYAAAGGSIMVSYVKARAEALGYEAKVGLLSRLERYIVLLPCLILNIPFVAVWILAILANFTALQRFFHVRKQARAAMKLAKKEQ